MNRRRAHAQSCFCALLAAMCGLGVNCPSLARACSTASAPPFSIDPNQQATDNMPPTTFGDLVAATRRISGTHCRGGVCSSTSCGDVGMVTLKFSGPSDDQTAVDQLGYRVVWLSGSAPMSIDGYTTETQPLLVPNQIDLDLGFDGIEQLNGDLALIAVDRAGNESAMSAPIHVEYSGCTEYFDAPGCAHASCSALGRVSAQADRPDHDWLLPLMAAGLLWMTRRRSRRVS